MKVAIFGATGIVGSAITEKALAKGHDVTVLTRDARRIKSKSDRLTVVEGDVMDRNTVRKVLEGQEAVVQSLGIGGKGDGKATSFVSDANKVIMEEMESMNVRRFIAISALGAGDSIMFLPWIFRKLIPVFMKWFQAVIDDKNRMEPMIEKSNLDWTIVRCTTVKEVPSKGTPAVSLDGKGLKFSIAAPDMAEFVVSQLSDKHYLYKAPVISN